MAEEAGAPECFICTESEPSPHRSACLCTDRYMHTECFAKLLKAQKGEPKCCVCGAPYEDVRWRTKRVVQWLTPCSMVGLLACTAIVLAGCAANTFSVLYSGRSLSSGTQAVAMGVGVFLSFVDLGALVCIAITLRHYGWREVWASRYREVKVIVLCPVTLPTRTTRNTRNTRTTPVELELGELATVDEANVP
jgi:hypothetical protein